MGTITHIGSEAIFYIVAGVVILGLLVYFSVNTTIALLVALSFLVLGASKTSSATMSKLIVLILIVYLILR